MSALNTTTWAQYPFTVNGINFVSKLDKEGSLFAQVSKLPVAIIDSMNTQAVKEMIGDPSLLTREELENEMVRINEGAVQALIELEA